MTSYEEQQKLLRVQVPKGTAGAAELERQGFTDVGIDTSQPSPETAKIQPPTEGLTKVPTEGVGPGGEPIFDIFRGGQKLEEPEFAKMGVNVADIPVGQAPSGFQSKFQRGFQQAARQGVKDVSGAGKANAIVEQYAPGKRNDLASTFVQSDDFLGGLVKTFQDYINPTNQRTSLRETYSQMLKDSGIQAIDLELVDMKNIIEGTEDDLRTEITKASGFATESQIQALTISRNKQLVKNYNTLVETRNAKEKYLQTAIGLEQADRQSADQRFNSMFNMGLQIANYQQQMQTNARNQMQWLTQNLGFDGLYDATGGDPYYMNLVERTLGLPQGGLLTSANQARLVKARAEQERQLGVQEKKLGIQLKGEEIKMKPIERELKAEQIKTERAQQAKIYADIGNMGSGIDEKTMGKIQASPEYKTINGVLPAIQSLKAYRDAISKYGTTEQFSGEGKGTLKGTYGNALATWKTLATLGALSGADFSLAENAVPETGFFKRASTSKAKLDASISNAIAQAESLTRRLQQNYPQATALLGQQLDEMKVSAYPERFIRGDDGLIYELE